MTGQTAVENAPFQPSREALMSVARKMADDEGLRDRAAAGDAADLLSELGIDTPPNVKVKILLEQDNVRHLVIRPGPSGRQSVSDEELEGVTGGAGGWEAIWGTGTPDGTDRWNDPNRP